MHHSDQRKDSSLGLTAFWILVLLVGVVAVILRVYDISLRPLHSDEGVNFHFINSIARDGFYRYSHENYHGPAYFYLTALFTSLFGVSDLSMRASAIVTNWALLPLSFLFLRTEKRFFVILSMAFIAVSSSMVFHARYSIHESLFVFSGAILGYSVYLWFRTRDARYHLLSGLGLGLLIATKETFIITLFCIFWSFLSLGSWKKVLKDLWQQRGQVIAGLFIAAVVIILLFSGGLQWPGGLREMFLAVPQWIGRNESDHGHFKPFFYYTQIIFGDVGSSLLGLIFNKSTMSSKTFSTPAEPAAWFIILLPLVSLAFIKKSLLFKDPVTRFFLVWTLLSLAVYSFVNYKTPWLIINITAPGCLLLAGLITQLSIPSEHGRRPVAILLSVCVVVVSLKATWLYVFSIPYGKGNPYSYVHTHQGMMRLLTDIKNESISFGKTDILIATNHYWPLPYYLRNHNGNTGYLKTDEPNDQLDKYDVLILDSRSGWSHPDWMKKYYRLSDVQESHTFFKVRR